MIDWIDIKKQRPERGVEVLAWVDDHRGPAWMNNHAEIVYLESNGKFYNWDDDKEYSVLYWAPLNIPDKDIVEALHPDMSKIPEFDKNEYLKDKEEWIKNEESKKDTIDKALLIALKKYWPMGDEDQYNKAIKDIKSSLNKEGK